MDMSADGAALSDDSNATQADISCVDSPTPTVRTTRVLRVLYASAMAHSRAHDDSVRS